MDPRARLHLRISRDLEEGAWDGPIARALSRAWGEVGGRSLARPLAWRRGLRVVAVGGATLGGSGKTPLAIGCARALTESGARVAFVGHGYRARTGAARIVRSDDDLAHVGDEALVASRALAGIAPVVVAPTRQAALDLAASLADVVVLDGVLQTTPRRASLSLLAVDEAAPWGAGEVVPRGDLRAPIRALLGACDRVVAIGDDQVRARGAVGPEGFLTWAQLSHLRLGLFVALSRPDRLTAFLARRGILPGCVIRVPDHGLPPAAVLARFAYPEPPRVDLWLASPKCALHLEAARLSHAVLEHAVEPPPELRLALAHLHQRDSRENLAP